MTETVRFFIKPCDRAQRPPRPGGKQMYRVTYQGEVLIESTGERTFALTGRGREWEPQSLDEKLRALLDYAIEERELGGEYFHQARMRRILLRLLKRVETGVWYDIMYLPFLARNTYLSNLDDLAVEDYFTARANGGEYGAGDDAQRLAWNLVGWVRNMADGRVEAWIIVPRASFTEDSQAGLFRLTFDDGTDEEVPFTLLGPSE